MKKILTVAILLMLICGVAYADSLLAEYETQLIGKWKLISSNNGELPVGYLNFSYPDNTISAGEESVNTGCEIFLTEDSNGLVYLTITYTSLDEGRSQIIMTWKMTFNEDRTKLVIISLFDTLPKSEYADKNILVLQKE